MKPRKCFKSAVKFYCNLVDACSSLNNLASFKLIFIFLFLNISSFAYSQVDVVHLKNGSTIKGNIIELTPGKELKIKTADESTWVFSMDEVEKISKEESKNSTNDRAKIAEETIARFATGQSNGYVELVEFTKEKGKEIPGLGIYTLEFVLIVKATKEFWKKGDPFEAQCNWQDFRVLQTAPSARDQRLNPLLIHTKHYRMNDHIRLRGTVNFDNTDEGWQYDPSSYKITHLASLTKQGNSSQSDIIAPNSKSPEEEAQIEALGKQQAEDIKRYREVLLGKWKNQKNSATLEVNEETATYTNKKGKVFSGSWKVFPSSFEGIYHLEITTSEGKKQEWTMGGSDIEGGNQINLRLAKFNRVQ